MSTAEDRPHISLVVIGHVDSGKSTTIGHLLHACGIVDDRKLAEYERESSILGMHPCTKFAWILDGLKAEREGSKTVDLSLWKLKSSKYDYTIIDTPGHRDYVKNMITGTSQADASLLIIDASIGNFEHGMGKDGQTREHALLAYALGVRRMIVCINKMDDDSVGYGEGRYNHVKETVSKCLRKVGYKTSGIAFVPTSGWKGDNIVDGSTENNMSWYSGPTLLGAMDALSPPKRQSNTPLRIPVQDVYKIGGIGTVIVGRVETGVIRPGMTIKFAPSGIIAEVRSCEVHHEERNEVGPGNNVGFNVRNVSIKDVRRGDVVSDANDNPARRVTSFEAQIVVMNHPGRITVGYCPVIDCHTAHVACRFENIREKLDRRTGKVVETNPEYLRNGDAAIVTLVPTRPMCVESFDEYPPLGRFAIRDMRTTVAVGVIRSIMKEDVDGA
jgi:elongation factor 1-alpha